MMKPISILSIGLITLLLASCAPVNDAAAEVANVSEQAYNAAAGIEVIDYQASLDDVFNVLPQLVVQIRPSGAHGFTNIVSQNDAEMVLQADPLEGGVIYSNNLGKRPEQLTINIRLLEIDGYTELRLEPIPSGNDVARDMRDLVIAELDRAFRRR